MMKILLLRFSSIGDIVLTSPVARCLKQQLGAEVHFLTKKSFAALLEPNPYLDRIFFFEKKLGKVLPELRQEKYDWVIDLHGNLRSLRVKWTLRRPSRTFDKLNLKKWMLVKFGLNLLPDQHIVDRYLKTVQHLGVEYDGLGLDYFIPESEEIQVSSLSPDLEVNAYVVFNLGANHATKRLPEDKIIEICQQVERPVVLLGGNAEADTGAKVAAVCGVNVVNCCGMLSLHQSASVVRQAAKIITHDSGMMHVAAACQKDIVSIWGNTVPQFGMYPLYPNGENRDTRMEVSGLSCRPCSKIGYSRCPKGHFRCMREQDIPAIVMALK